MEVRVGFPGCGPFRLERSWVTVLPLPPRLPTLVTFVPVADRRHPRFDETDDVHIGVHTTTQERS
jgi:hypothetical protein